MLRSRRGEALPLTFAFNELMRGLHFLRRRSELETQRRTEGEEVPDGVVKCVGEVTFSALIHEEVKK